MIQVPQVLQIRLLWQVMRQPRYGVQTICVCVLAVRSEYLQIIPPVHQTEIITITKMAVSKMHILVDIH